MSLGLCKFTVPGKPKGSGMEAFKKENKVGGPTLPDF